VIRRTKQLDTKEKKLYKKNVDTSGSYNRHQRLNIFCNPSVCTDYYDISKNAGTICECKTHVLG